MSLSNQNEDPCDCASPQLRPKYSRKSLAPSNILLPESSIAGADQLEIGAEVCVESFLFHVQNVPENCRQSAD